MALYPDLSVRENLRFFGRLYRLPGRSLERRVEEVLERVDLGTRARDRVDSLSGGMRRRLNIGAGLVHSPTLLVLDEPTVGVDPQSRHAILESVHRFGEEGMAVLYTTHYMEEAERLCDGFDQGLTVARCVERASAPVAVRAETVNGTSQYLPLGYSYSTPTMLVLFVLFTRWRAARRSSRPAGRVCTTVPSRRRSRPAP